MSDMHEPLVAVITRTKDRPFMLERAIDSISKQTLADYVLVIVNDGGKQEAVEKALAKYKEKLKGRVKVVHNKKSVGMEAASNIGLKQCKSKYIALLDDDDTWHPDFLKATTSFLENNPSFGGVVTVTDIVNEVVGENNAIRKISQERFKPDPANMTLFAIAGTNQYTNNSFVYVREAVAKIGYYDESLPVLGDWDFNVRFIQEYDIGFIDKTLAYYHKRQSDGSPADNTMVGVHHDYTKRLLNKALRNDLKKNKSSIGEIANISYSIAKFQADEARRREDKTLTEQHVRNLTSIIETQKKHIAELQDEIRNIKSSKTWKLATKTASLKNKVKGR